jgi:hypothetical protein
MVYDLSNDMQLLKSQLSKFDTENSECSNSVQDNKYDAMEFNEENL